MTYSGLGTCMGPCGVISPNFHALNGWDYMDWPQVIWDLIWTSPNLGPLHTWAKRLDHVIVRAQKKCPKAVPTHFKSHVVLSWALKCNVKPYVVGPQMTLYPSCIHLLRWSLKHIVKWTCTSSAFPTNESTWSAMVMGPQSRVWSGPTVKGQRSRAPRLPPIKLQKTKNLAPIPFTIEAKVQMPSLSKIPTWHSFLTKATDS